MFLVTNLLQILAHLNELVNITKGYIANPPVSMVRDDEEPYAWRIVVKRGEFIELMFREYNQGLKVILALSIALIRKQTFGFTFTALRWL